MGDIYQNKKPTYKNPRLVYMIQYDKQLRNQTYVTFNGYVGLTIGWHNMSCLEYCQFDKSSILV